MVMMYEENQKRAMDKLMRNEGSPNGNNGGKSVREFFNERRRMEASGAPVPPIDSHFRQAKGYNSPGGWSSRTGSGNSMKAQKVSAGRDRAHPLAPIRRPMDTQEVANNGTGQRSGIPQKQQNGYYEDNPFTDKPKLVKHKPLPSTNGHNEPEPQENGMSNFRKAQMKYNSNTAKPPPHQNTRQGQPPRQYQQLHQQQQQQQPARPIGQPRPPANGQPTNTRSPGRGQGQGQGQQQKMTDFQKWQMEQHKNRDERLKKFQDKQSPRVWDGRFGELENEHDAYGHGDGYSNGVEYEDEDDDDEGYDQDDDVAQQERELLAQIAKQKAELDRVKSQRQQLEEEEKRDQERLKKKEAMDRARQKKLEEEERREEERRRREEEEDLKYEKQREEKRRREMEKQKKEDEKRRKEEERLMAKRQKEEDKRMRDEEKRMREEERRMREEEKRQAKKQAKLSSRSNYNDYEDESPTYSSRQQDRSPRKQGNMTDRSLAEDLDERPAVAAGASSSNYYAQVAKSSDAKGSVGSLGRCKHCGRQFATDRLKKHQDACAKVQKPRKEFDASKKRVEGTELAKYAGKSKKPEPPKKKNNWRAKHEEFIQNLRYAKKVTQMEKEGGDLRNLPPPPTTQNPDLVPCPYCNRTFNETAAARHIPRCKDLKTRPPPMNTSTKRR